MVRMMIRMRIRTRMRIRIRIRMRTNLCIWLNQFTEKKINSLLVIGNLLQSQVEDTFR